MSEKRNDEQAKKPGTLGDVWRDLCRQFRTNFREGVERAHAAREAAADRGKPAPGLTDDEQARLETLLNSWPGPTEKESAS